MSSVVRKPTSTVGLESAHGMALIQWADTQVRLGHPELRFLHHIPNGGARSKATAGRMKAEGIRSGVWDYLLPVKRTLVAPLDGHPICGEDPLPNETFMIHALQPSKKYSGLYIELKHPRERSAKNGGLSDKQVDFGTMVQAEGFATVVAYDWIEAQQAILAYLAGNEVPFFWVSKVRHETP